ncbi:MAG TPA: methyltransferase domain-containing protein [Castellaniella sp.]|uniref:class I SAM-dependent methyltransferase n=1 Tax=Castellaniella sp. TaxID=1955812 RepID=UPI002EDDF784
MEAKSHQQKIQTQFDPQAEAYLHSRVHSSGPDLLRAQEIIQELPGHAEKQLLDVGCGAGHLSFALAPWVKHVTATDPLPGMLDTVKKAAADRALRNVNTSMAVAERLPFKTAQFDIVATRYSAHHWENLPAALIEMRRVLKPGGLILIIDLQGDENPLVDTHLQTMELLRDPSHLRDRSPSEWARLLAAAGFAGIAHESWPTRLEFQPWVTRMRTPPKQVEVIRILQCEAPEEVQSALKFEEDGSFTATTGLWWGRG